MSADAARTNQALARTIRDMAFGAVLVIMILLGYRAALSNGPLSSSRTQAAAADAATGALAASAASSTADTSSASSSDQSTQQTTDVNTYYQYQLLFSVDPCTLNKMGKGGWQPVEYGKDPSTGDDLMNVNGRDMTCTQSGHFMGFIWILFQRSTTTPIKLPN